MLKVLLIEDDETARTQLAKYIGKEGFQVIQAENGRVGLDMFHAENPDIVLTDMKMPDVDGMEVVHTVKRLAPEVQVIVFTAFGEVDTAVAVLREGVLDYLKKPIDLDLLSIAMGRAREKIAVNKEGYFYPHILLVEDEEIPRKKLKRVLEKEDWKVFEACDGIEALEQFRLTRFDVVLTDLKMPRMDGLQALVEMRKMSDNFEAIILTGYGDERSAIEAMRSGAMNFLKKPIDLDQMIVSVEKALEKLAASRALKYRTRELELAKQIITQITQEQEVIISVSEAAKEHTKAFAQKLLDAIPLAIFVIDKSFKIRYTNKSLTVVIGYSPTAFDDELITSLKKMGVCDLSIEKMSAACDGLFESVGGIEVIATGTYSYLTLTLLTYMEREKEKLIMVALRGERPPQDCPKE
jgi:DNA-binding NtrC family response regulator